MIALMSIVTIGMFIIVSILDTKKIRSLEKMAENRDKYIQLLERRAREERIYKNKN